MSEKPVDDMTLASVIASNLRWKIKAALIAEGLDPHDDTTVGYLAARLCERDGRSLRDEIATLKGRARAVMEDR